MPPVGREAWRGNRRVVGINEEHPGDRLRLLDLVVKASRHGIVVTDPNLPDNPIVYVNPAFEKLTGYTAEEALGKNCRFLQGGDRRDHAALMETRSAIKEGCECRVVLLNHKKDGTPFWNDLSISPVRDESGRLINFVGVQEDVTERKRAEDALREQTETFEKLNRVGQLLSSELDGQKLMQAVTNEATQLTGAAYGAFLDVTDGHGDSYTLYAISGLPREASSKFPMPRDARIFGPTFGEEGAVRFDDLREMHDYGDPRYGVLAEDHLPAASYLAVPVVSRSGEVLGGLFFGHPEPGVFGEREEGIATALAAQAAVAVDNARLFESVRESEERYKILYEDNPSMYFTLDEGGRVLSVNRFGAEHLGYAPDELVGRSALELFHEEDESNVRRHLDACLKSPGSLGIWEARKRSKDGSILWVEERANAVKTAGGSRIVLVVSEDVTERKHAEEALREVRQAERARIARDIHDEALQDIVHALQQIEIEKALSGGGGVSADLDEVSAALKRSVEGLRSAIYDLRLDRHREQGFAEMLASLVKTNRRRSPGREFKFSIEEGATTLPLDKEGQVELLRILQEALTNARRHSGAQTISVVVGTSGDKLRAEVSDDGRGFGVEDAPGMGTRNMRERARALGGELEVESRPGEGTTVRFEMPLSRGGAEEDVARILLVEDHASFRQAIALVLNRTPELRVVGQAGSLQEAREVIGAEPVDVAIVDLGLPDGYGGGLIQELRDANPEAQALVLSASLDRSEIARAVEYGAAGVLHKSSGMDEVVEAVRRLRAGETLLSISEVVELLRFAGARRKEEHEARHALAQLTPREREVLQALAEGLDGREIAERLSISVATERNHTARILAKLGVHSRLQALVFALRYGVVEIG